MGLADGDTMEDAVGICLEGQHPRPCTPPACLLQEEARVLVDGLLELDALGLMVHRLSTFDEKVGWGMDAGWWTGESGRLF